MLSVPKRNFANARFLIGTALLLCALTFYYFAVLNVDYYKTGLLDLGWSDPSQYFAQAKAMMKDGYPYLNFGYQKLPATYPPGYPALMLPWLKVLPEADSILAPFRTNQTIGLLLLLATFGFYCYLEMPLTGGFAGSFAGDPAWFLHLLPFIVERSQRFRPHCAGVHGCLSGPKGRTPLENLSIGDFSWPFTERSCAVVLLRTAVVGYGSLPK